MDSGDLTYFLLHQSDVLATAVDRLHAYVERRRSEIRTLDKVLNTARDGDLFNHRQSALLNDLIRNRVIELRLTDHQNRWRVSYITARNDLDRLVGLRLLKKRKSGRVAIYAPVPGLAARIDHIGTH